MNFIDADTINILLQSFQTDAIKGLPANITTIAVLVMELITLANLRCPLFGLRAIPIYGDYYLYKMLIPHKKKLAILSIIISILCTIFLIIFVIALILWMFTLASDKTSDMTKVVSTLFLIGSIVLWGISMIALFIVDLLLNFEIAERFNYNKYLGILFAIIPISRAICMIVKSKEVISVQDYNLNIQYNENIAYDQNKYEQDNYYNEK